MDNPFVVFALEFTTSSGKDDAIIFSTNSNSDMREFIALLEMFKKTGTEYNIVRFASIASK